MTPQAIQKCIDIMAERGIPQDDAMQVLALVAEQLNNEKTIAKAKRSGLSVDEVRGMDAGRDVAQKLNAKLFGRKS